MDKLVSIIMPLYNAEKFIAATVEGVLAQTYTYWELIIVDDQSTDSSYEIALSYVSDARIRISRLERNSGPVEARNKAIELSGGQIIAFLDADDFWVKETLAIVVSRYLKYPTAALIYSDYQIVDEFGAVVKERIVAPEKATYATLLKGNYIACSSASYNVEILGKRYFNNYGHEDFVLWLSILKNGHLALNTRECLMHYRRLPNSLSSNKLRAAKWQWKIYREVESLGLFKSSFLFFNYFINAAKKHF